MKHIIAIILLVGLLCSPVVATVSTFAKDGPYTGDSSANQAFTITFEFFDTSEVVATQRLISSGAETALTETTHYTIAGTGSDPYTGGTLTLANGYTIASTSTLTISRAMTQNQEADFQTGGPFPSDTVEDQYDKLAMQIQDLQEQIDRCLKVPITDGSTVEAATELDDAIQRADCYLTFTSAGLPTATASALASTATTTTYTETLLDDANEAAFWTTLGFSAGVQSVLDDATLTAMKTTLGIAAITVLDEDDMGAGSGSAVSPPSQDSVYEFLVTTAATMASKTLTSPVFNTGVSGTAVLDENNMASDSDTQIATQQSIKKYVDDNIGAVPSYVQYSYTVADGNDGGSSTSGSWQTRAISNEDSDDDNIGALVANQITLDAGTYRFQISMTMYRHMDARIRLYNTTGAADLGVSCNNFAAQVNNTGGVLSIHGQFMVADSVQALELQYNCNQSVATVGLGNSADTGDSEVYAVLSFWQVN